MVECTVLFFGHTAEIVGTRKLPMTVLPGVMARQIFDDLVSKYPRLGGLRLLLSINQQYAGGDEIVRDGDELAVFTAVSGG